MIGRTPALRACGYIVALCFKQRENGRVWDSVSFPAAGILSASILSIAVLFAGILSASILFIAVLIAGILSTSILSIAILFAGILSDLQPARMALLRDAGLQAREIE